MKAELDTITITLYRGRGEDWPSAYEQRALADDIEREFDVIETAGPYTSGSWSFVMRERNHVHAVARINELIHEHVGDTT